MDKEKKKSIFIYVGLIICFIFFSIFVFNKKGSDIVKSTTDKGTQNNTVNNNVDNTVDNINNEKEEPLYISYEIIAGSRYKISI